MKGRRTSYEIYWEILVYCRTARSFTAVIGRCDLNSKTGQEYIAFLCSKGYLDKVREGGKTLIQSTEAAKEYIDQFSGLYQKLFDKGPEFRLQ
jgi:predicted transcriptional regulator